MLRPSGSLLPRDGLLCLFLGCRCSSSPGLLWNRLFMSVTPGAVSCVDACCVLASGVVLGHSGSLGSTCPTFPVFTQHALFHLTLLFLMDVSVHGCLVLKNFHMRIYSPEGHNGQNWTDLKPGARSSILCCFPRPELDHKWSSQN